ncbi:MAG: hypothetical protein U5L45_00835 [Saprospiraceae bacterium]|nr:hypothetical protein [Saprospiraceae bacterium]
MVRFSGFARKTNHMPLLSSEASNRLSSKKMGSLTILAAAKEPPQQIKHFCVKKRVNRRSGNF